MDNYFYGGIRIIVNDTLCAVQPRMQVSREFARIQSSELVAETNKWMREFFGYPENEGKVFKITDPYNGQEMLAMSSAHLETIKSKYREEIKNRNIWIKMGV